ncbi:hypothetical protein [Sediminibacillus massiliensis]|uniref:hypothetical protein n=1 Tax=Sediminibacillus massiliensis TaxID=1926277 RepID=UPI00098849D9|nr:hypothetical protein [Sediminibacillus massiliensis]
MWLGRGSRGRVEEIGEDKDGLVTIRIVVDRVNRKQRKVKVFIIEQVTGKSLFRLRYFTEKSELYSYYGAREHAVKFAEENDYIIDHESTNVTLPTIVTVNKRSR